MAKIHPFDPNQHEKHVEMEPLPSGWYPMKIVRDEVKPTKDDPEQAYLEVEYEMDDRAGAHLKGRHAWDRLNLYNKNEKAVKIANGMLKSICVAVGHVGPVSDTTVLHGKPMAVKLKLVPARGEFPAKNEVVDVDQLGARFPQGFAPQSAPAGGSTRPPSSAPAAPSADTSPSTPPWGGAPAQG